MTAQQTGSLDSLMTTDTTFWNNIARKYSAKPVADQAAYEKKLRLTQDYFEPDMQVLEIGCGTGSTALVHAPHVKRIIATDFASEMLQIAQEKAQTAGISNIEFVCQDARQSLESSQPYDVIMAHSLLHLVPQPFELVKDIYDALKPGGYFISSTVCLDGAMRAMKLIWPMMTWLKKFPAIEFFGVDELVQAHKQTGFEIVYQWEPSKRNVFLIARKPS